jgi:SOS-response transcriptional repressor LexA
MNEKQTEKLRPTKKQKELLGFIDSFIAEHGYSPSYRRNHEWTQLYFCGDRITAR